MGCKNECILTSTEEADNNIIQSQIKVKNRNLDYESQDSKFNTIIFNMDSLREECLHYANFYRRRHNASDLIFNDDLNQISQASAIKIAETDTMTKSQSKYHNDLLGENLYASTIEMTGNAIISEWYNEGQYLQGLSPQYTPETENYTQLLWKASRMVGFGFAKSKSGWSYCVASFYPQGNHEDYEGNVDNGEVKTVEKTRHAKPNTMLNEETEVINETQLAERFMKDAHKAQNEYRKMHHVAPLKLNKEICKIAQEYALEMAMNDMFQQSNNVYKDEELGESLYMCQGKPIIAKDVIDNWYNEKEYYDFNRGEFNPEAGHFTQMVWKDTTDVGFGCARSISGIYYAVVSYYPPGNYQDVFLTNVFPSESD